MTDAQLIRKAASGDPGAFEQLYERHWKAVYSYCWLLTQSVPDSEDITQDCFMALFRKPGSFDPDRAQLRTWLIAVVRRQHLGRSRRLFLEGSARKSGDDAPEEFHVAAGQEEELLSAERADAVHQAMNALPQAQREALYLFEFEGLSMSDTAGVLDIEVNAVKARLYRAREQLKLLLAPLQPTGKATP